MSAENVAQRLAAQSGESVEWPTDAAFSEAWRSQHAYRILDNAKIVYILRRLSDTYYESKMEPISIQSPLTVEHILPQQWIDHWPLGDGSEGMSHNELVDADEDDPRAVVTRRRHALLQTFGNLTILTQSLNSAVSNGPWITKKPDLLRYSLLPINQQLHDQEVWDEAAIGRRSDELLARALKLWPRL